MNVALLLIKTLTWAAIQKEETTNKHIFPNNTKDECEMGSYPFNNDGKGERGSSWQIGPLIDGVLIHVEEICNNGVEKLGDATSTMQMGMPYVIKQQLRRGGHNLKMKISTPISPQVWREEKEKKVGPIKNFSSIFYLPCFLLITKQEKILSFIPFSLLHFLSPCFLYNQTGGEGSYSVSHPLFYLT